MNKTLLIQIVLFILAILSLLSDMEEFTPILFTFFMLLFLLSCGLEDDKPIPDENYLRDISKEKE